MKTSKITTPGACKVSECLTGQFSLSKRIDDSKDYKPPEAYSEPCQASSRKSFAKINNCS